MKKTALITGGARGIGFGIAEKLAADGCDIAIMDLHPEEAVEENLKKLESQGVRAIYCKGDVTRAHDRQATLKKIQTELGPLNILVNNAGVAPKVRADILEASEESFERLMRINLQGPYFLTQLVANAMISEKEKNAEFAACIINISSISSTVASPSRGEYCISKAGVSMATKLWAARLGEFDIPVYEIRPGIIMTDMTSGVKEKYDNLIANGLTRQQRWGYPEDIGKAAAMLARGDLPYSTGQVVMVDGGMTVDVL